MVQAAEDTGLAERAHPRQEDKTQVGVGILEHSVEAPELRSHKRGQLDVGQGVKDGLVVLVDKDDDGGVGLPAG